MESKVCTKCGKKLPLSKGYFGHTPRGNFRGACRKCMARNSAKAHSKDPEKLLARVAKRKEQEKQAQGAYTEHDITQIRKNLSDKCRYCGVSLKGGGDIEHIIPISRGGTQWPSNITLACFSCNKEKHGKTLLEYLAWRKRLGLSCRKQTPELEF